jgi:drug/metabolite transporter (DMT)-like permease
MITSPLWLPATLAAGGLQAWRTAVQRRVGKTLSVNAAGLVRYLYGLPFALVMGLAYVTITGHAPARLDGLFLLFCAAGGLAQILATNLLLMAFAEGNFVAGTAYSKTEAVQGAIFSAVLLGEHLQWIAWAGIATGVVGVMVLAAGGARRTPRDLLRAFGHRAAGYGIASGTLFALCAVGIRRATFELAMPDPIGAALITLCATVLIQTLMQGAWLAWREPDQFRPMFASWRVSGQVGLLSSVGSACWFTGFAAAPVALVRIVGQVEVAFTLAFAHFYLREGLKPNEVAGLLLVATGVVLALIGAR